MADYIFGIGEELSFNSQDTDFTHAWDFGDGSPISTDSNPSHIYTSQGIYTITHSMSDFCSTCTMVSHTVEISPASITVSDIFLDKYIANIGETIAITVIAQNLSQVYGTSTITVKFDNNVISTYAVTLNPGEQVVFNISQLLTSSGTITPGSIQVCADNVCRTLIVVSSISIRSINLDKNIVNIGDPVIATIQVQNTGTSTEDKNVKTLLYNLTTMTIDDRTVSVPPGGVQSFQIPISTLDLEAGAYLICTESICKALSVLAALPPPVTVGSINFISVPSGASVFIDSVEQVGMTTPVTIPDIVIGNHSYKLTKVGYNDVIGDIIVEGGITSRVYVNMSVLTPTTGSISISSNPQNADIYLNDVQLLDINNQPLRTPSSINDLIPASYTVTLKKAGYYDFNIILSVAAGQTISINPVLISTTGARPSAYPFWLLLGVGALTYWLTSPGKPSVTSVYEFQTSPRSTPRSIARSNALA